MDMVSRWEEKVIQKGMQKGMEHVVLRLLRLRLGNLPADVERRIDGLTSDQIDALTDMLLEIQSVDQVAAWLSPNWPSKKARKPSFIR